MLVIATVGLVYELVMAAVATYLLGDSIKQFSLIIGVYLSALGAGAYLSRYVGRRLASTFVDVELAAAVLGGLSAPALLFAFGFTGAFEVLLYGFVVGVGVLVGLELPLLMRILRKSVGFKDLIAKALTFDYAGALVGSIGFSIVLVPHLGLIHTSLLCGLLNAIVGLASTWLLPVEDDDERRRMTAARARAAVVTLLMVTALAMGQRIADWTEAFLYPDPIVVSSQSAYQRIVVTEKSGHVRLYLNGNLQFASVDEHRYHEALVHPAMASTREPKSVLIGGGGDGLAVREVLKWPSVERVVLVDLDPVMTSLARHDERLAVMNQRALWDAKVSIVNEDAMVWLDRGESKLDVMIFDFPDPSNYSLGKLYSRRFYGLAKRRLAEGGVLVVQSTSPLFARNAYWCVVSTLESVGLTVHPYHVFVPSFGEWGYVIAKARPFSPPAALPPLPLRYLDDGTLAGLFVFPEDMRRAETTVNRLDNQAVVRYYLAAWERWR